MMNFDYRNVLNDLTSSGYYYIDPNVTATTTSEGFFVMPSVFSLHDNNSSNNSDTIKPCEVCGWLAAFCSMLAFGSFGVPIKSKVARSVDIDPLVFQSYKTTVCFLTSWFILAAGEEFSFTPWGIVSGIFWVPGGVATVYAIKAAGLAIGIGIGSSCIVLVSFIWGIFIFQEKVYSKFMACLAILCMMIGLFGMSYFSSQTANSNNNNNNNREIVDSIEPVQNPNHDVLQQSNDNYDDETISTIPSPIIDSTIIGTGQHLRRRSFNKSDPDIVNTESSAVSPSPKGAPRVHSYQGLNTHSVDEEDPTTTTLGQTTEGTGPIPPYRHLSFAAYSSRSYNNNGFIDTATDSNDDDTSTGDYGPSGRGRVNRCNNTSEIDFIEFDEDGGMYIYCCNVYLTKRQRGMLSAAFCGLYGGSIMAPMKFAPPDAKGTHYLLSFAIGAAIVNLSLWILRYLINSYYYGSFSVAYNALPSFHIHVMWLPGGISGLLWSIGNYFSLISVLYLGEGVGYPLVQTSILVSGLWGIFYFKEVQGYEQISKWFMSSLLTIFGILLLSYEHHAQ